MPACVSKQSKFPANSPISFIFSFLNVQPLPWVPEDIFFLTILVGGVNEARSAGRKK